MARFVLSEGKVLEQYECVKQLCDAVSYSWKTNPVVGEVLKDSDCDFSVHSINELKAVGDAKRVWFFAQGWNTVMLDELFSLGVRRFVVDNDGDLKVLLSYLDQHAETIDLLLRMRFKEHTIHTGKHFVYGMYTEQIEKWIPQLKENKNINKLGIHFHRKTQNVSEWGIKEELERLTVLDELDLVNIGGGIPVHYKNFRSEVLTSIFNKIQELKIWLNDNGIMLLIEPGRFVAGPAVKLEAEILNIYDNTLIVDCSVFNAALDTFIAHNRLLVEGELERGIRYTIKGCVPDSLDIFRYCVFLSAPAIGKKIVFLNAGAYTMHTDFCGLERVETVIVD